MSAFAVYPKFPNWSYATTILNVVSVLLSVNYINSLNKTHKNTGECLFASCFPMENDIGFWISLPKPSKTTMLNKSFVESVN